MSTVEGASKFFLWLLFGIFLMHAVLQHDGWAWIKSKMVVDRQK